MPLTQDILRRISDELSISSTSVKNTFALLEEGATIPFISRYRKEQTGSLDELQVGAIQEKSKYYTTLEKRKVYILKTIEDLGKITPNLKDKIEQSYDLTYIEDLFLPYKPKRQTRGVKAKAKGLEPLAKVIFDQRNQAAPNLASKYITDEVATEEGALNGAKDIIAEWINEDASIREKVRRLFERKGFITSRVLRGKQEDGQKFKDYFDYQEAVRKCPPHRIHALLRGDKEGFLLVKIAPLEDADALELIDRSYLKGEGDATDVVADAIEDCYKRLIQPSMEYEFRKKLKELADTSAIDVFADNAKKLFLAPPLGQKRIIGVDPGFRTGCKVVVLDEKGDLLENTTIYPHPPQKQTFEAQETIKALAYKHQVKAIAIGNGTAGRETHALLNKIDFEQATDCFLISESGASIYSASDIAREEFPDLDLTVRGAISIARRLMDPLAELVKIDPKSVGVGQYQHDVDQTKLKDSLTTVVESCVNSVGVNLNTASKHLLTYISGLGPVLADNIVAHRNTNGAFTSRKDLLSVPRMGAKAFEQCAGFLRIRDAKHPLDNTGVHPERYKLVEKMAKEASVSIDELIEQKGLRQEINLQKYLTDEVGLPTLKDIIAELDKPGLDPRGEAKTVQFESSVNTINDLKDGMILTGIVTNVINFGAFVNIGIKNEGLVHISHIANRFLKHPSEVLSVQDEVKVKVVGIDLDRGRVQLSIKEAV